MSLIINKMARSRKKSTKKKTKKVKITPKLVSAAEYEHIGWMSTIAYYQQVWNYILSDVPGAQLGPIVLVKKGSKGQRRKNLDFPILTADAFGKLVRSQANEPTPQVLVWPVGVLYRGGDAVHWNVFIYKRGARNIIRFDPGVACYAYSDAVINRLSDGFGKPVNLMALKTPCQVDQCGTDHFCQTWIMLLADYYLHVTDKRKLLKFKHFDFFNKGKPLLKSWLRCIYKNLQHGPYETWFDYVNSKFPGLFYYHDDDNSLAPAPNMNTKQCWQILLKHSNTN